MSERESAMYRSPAVEGNAGAGGRRSECTAGHSKRDTRAACPLADTHSGIPHDSTSLRDIGPHQLHPWQKGQCEPLQFPGLLNSSLSLSR